MADLALGGAAIHRIACPFEPSGEADKRGFDALAEAVVHSPLLRAPLGRAHQHEALVAVRAGAQLGLDPVAHLAPVAGVDKLRREGLQLALARPDEIAPPGALQPRHGLGAGHAAVPHPDAARLTGCQSALKIDPPSASKIDPPLVEACAGSAWGIRATRSTHQEAGAAARGGFLGRTGASRLSSREPGQSRPQPLDGHARLAGNFGEARGEAVSGAVRIGRRNQAGVLSGSNGPYRVM